MTRIAALRFSNDLRRRADDHPDQVAITPTYILGPVRQMLGGTIGLDPCTTPDNPVDAVRFYTPPTDGAAEPWDADTIWCNPPYGQARERWVNRCIEAAALGRQVVLLIPAHTDTRAFQRALEHATTALLIRGRVKFGLPRANGRQVAATHPSALIAWNADLAHCGHLGLVIRPAAQQCDLFGVME